MKRNKLVAHLKKNGCKLFRNGANHDIFINQANGKMSAVGRHTELDNLYCKMICKQLEIGII
jgi:mRNA interferase HicA